jgi:teichoic acid transport system permease protein
MKAIIQIIIEQINSFYLILRLSFFELKSENNNNYLGILWEVINPMIQIGIYWFVFGAMRGGRTVNGIPFVEWLLAGIVVWFFVYQGTLQSSKSIYTRIRLIAKMSFPMSTIPSFVIMSKFYQHLILVGIIIVIFQFMGQFVSIHYVMLPYFMFATIALIFSFTLITSTLSTIIRDVQMVVQSLLRVLIYLTPILWTMNNLKPWIHDILLLNPLYYIVEGYRASLLGTSWYPITHWHYTLYFWAVIFVFMLIGSLVHIKFRDRFVDFL